jgi:hypothetical protein
MKPAIAYYRVSQGARLGNPTNTNEAAALGRTAQKLEADRFAANVLLIVAAIRASGVTTPSGITEALNARGVRSARGERWHISSVQNLVARSEAAAL